VFEGNTVLVDNVMSDLTCSTEAGWVGRDAILMTGINALIYLLATTPTWVLVDRWGRRFILLSGAVVVSVSLLYSLFLGSYRFPDGHGIRSYGLLHGN
jgi:predicted MFS family arabinose efflux permease